MEWKPAPPKIVYIYDCPGLPPLPDVDSVPCYIVQRYYQEMASVQPSAWRRFWEARGRFCDFFDFEEGNVMLRFTVPGLNSSKKGMRPLLIFAEGKRQIYKGKDKSPYNKHTETGKKLYPKDWAEVDAHDLYKADPSRLCSVYCALRKGNLNKWESPIVCKIVQKFLRYMFLRGYFNPDCVYIFGNGEGAVGGNTAAYLASCLPDTFAALYAADADISEYITPQLANMAVYVQFSQEYIFQYKGRGVIERVKSALKHNNIKTFSSSDDAINITLDASFFDQVMDVLWRNGRDPYPRDIHFRIFDSAAHYSFYNIKLKTKNPPIGAWGKLKRELDNEYTMEQSSDIKLNLLLNDMISKLSNTIHLKTNKKYYRIYGLFLQASKDAMDESLALKGDIHHVFPIEIKALPNPSPLPSN